MNLKWEKAYRIQIYFIEIMSLKYFLMKTKLECGSNWRKKSCCLHVLCNIVHSRYLAVLLSKNTHIGYYVARPWGRGTMCLMWVSPTHPPLCLLLLYRIQCCVILDRDILSQPCIVLLVYTSKRFIIYKYTQRTFYFLLAHHRLRHLPCHGTI